MSTDIAEFPAVGTHPSWCEGTERFAWMTYADPYLFHQRVFLRFDNGTPLVYLEQMETMTSFTESEVEPVELQVEAVSGQTAQDARDMAAALVEAASLLESMD